MSIFLSLLMPATLLVTALIRKGYFALHTERQRRCLSHIVRVVGGGREVQPKPLLRLRRHYSRREVCTSLDTIAHTLRGSAIEGVIRVGEACDISIHSILRRPDHAVVYVANMQRPLSLCEAAHLTSTLLANNAPIAYTPLLSSRNRNLQLVGLHLVYHFGFIDAEHLIQQMVASREPTISVLALHTLCSICGNMRTRGVVAHFERLSERRRLAIVRHAVQSCYSPQSLAHLLNRQEQQEFEGRVSSYKSSILCS